MLAFLGKTVRCNTLNGLAHSEERRLDTPDNREAPICLHFGSGPLSGEPSFLQRLASSTGGSYLYVDMAERR